MWGYWTLLLQAALASNLDQVAQSLAQVRSENLQGIEITEIFE